MSDIEKMGIHEVTEEALWKIDPEHESSIHLSFDIDALDTLEAPATGTPGNDLNKIQILKPVFFLILKHTFICFSERLLNPLIPYH